jgi:hypothetical protein
MAKMSWLLPLSDIEETEVESYQFEIEQGEVIFPSGLEHESFLMKLVKYFHPDQNGVNAEKAVVEYLQYLESDEGDESVYLKLEGFMVRPSLNRDDVYDFVDDEESPLSRDMILIIMQEIGAY